MAYKLLEEPEPEVKTSKKGRYKLLSNEPSQDTGSQVARGSAQGVLDIAALPGLALYPIERGIQKVAGIEDQKGRVLPGQKSRWGAEHEILTKMEDPNYKPSFTDFMLLSGEDEFAPESRGNTLLGGMQEVNEEIPAGGATQELIRRGVRNLPFLLGGPQAYGQAVGSDLTGYGVSSAVKGMGGDESAQLVGDILGSLGYGFKNAFKAAPTKIPAVAEQTGGLLAQAEHQGSKNVYQKKIQELDDSIIKNYENNTAKISEKTFNDFPTFEAQEINNDIVKANQANFLNKIAPEVTPEIAWTNIAEDVENAYQKEREIYSNLYTEARKRAISVKFDPTESRNLAAKLVRTIKNVDTTAPGYETVGKALNTALSDMGVTIENINGQAKVKTTPVTIDKLMDVGIRLGEIINYETLTPSIKDLLKPLVRNIKKDIRTGLRNQSPLGYTAFDKAEHAFGKTADRFGNDAIMKLRKTEVPEDLTNYFSSPSNYKRLKEVTDKNFLNMADRQIIESAAAKGTDKARKELLHLERYLDKSNKQIADSLINLGDKLTAPGQKAAFQEAVLQDVQKAITSGQRPNNVIKAMQTPEGYAIVKQTLERTLKGKEVFKIMQKQFVQDVFQSMIDGKGKIDWEKAANLIKDPQVKTVLKSIGGEDLVSFFRSLEQYGTNISNNMARYGSKLYGSKQTDLLSQVSKVAKSPTKALLTAITGSAFGVLPGAAFAAGSFVATEAFWRMLANPKVQGIIKSLAKPETYNKNALLPLIHKLNSEL